MKPVKVILGFVPFFVFSPMTTNLVGVGWAATLGLLAAIVVAAATAQGGVKVLPVGQAVVLLGIAILGFTGGGPTDAVLAQYGPAIAALLLGLFMIVTASSSPFTAQFARSDVPAELWHSSRFLQVNRRISTAWGFAVLTLGICHVLAAQIGVEGGQLVLRLMINWGLPLLAFWRAGAYTKRTAAAAHHDMQERNAA